MQTTYLVLYSEQSDLFYNDGFFFSFLSASPFGIVKMLRFSNLGVVSGSKMDVVSTFIGGSIILF